MGGKRALNSFPFYLRRSRQVLELWELLVLLLLLWGGGSSLSEYNLAAYCIWYFGFINSLRGGILNSKGFYLTLRFYELSWGWNPALSMKLSFIFYWKINYFPTPTPTPRKKILFAAGLWTKSILVSERRKWFRNFMLFCHVNEEKRSIFRILVLAKQCVQ